MAAPSANWSAFQIQIPGKDFLEKIRNVLETLLIYLDVLKAVLDTIKTFLVDFGNPVRVLVEALLKLVQDLFEALKRTGLYAYYDVPDLFHDPSLKRHLGGGQGFTLRFKGSLLDTKDASRPQPVKGALKGGFILIVADAEGPLTLVSKVQTLLKFFGREFISPRFLPPANMKALPVGAKGDPILSVAKAFSGQVQAIALEWTLPSSTPSGTGNAAFQGIASHVGQELVPPKWLVERAEAPLTHTIDIDPNTDDDKLRLPTLAGTVRMRVETSFIDPRHITTPVIRTQPVVDEFGDPYIKFNTAIVLGYGSASFLLGQLGTYRFIDTNVEFDKTYYYRVRAFTGPLDIDETTGVINFKGPLDGNPNHGPEQRFLKWPSTEPQSSIVVGKPSSVLQVKLAKLPANFDVMANLRALFLTAFSLNFQLPLPQPDPVLDTHGKPVLDANRNPVYKPLFDDAGNPIAPLTVTDIGKGSLADQAGLVIGLSFAPVVTTSSPMGDFAISTITGQFPEQPWQSTATRFQVARLTNRFGSLLLGNGTAAIEGFRQLMQGPLPKGPVHTSWDKVVPTTLEQLVLAFTKVHYAQIPEDAIASAILEINPTGTVDANTARSYGDAYSDEAVRRNVLAAVTYLKAHGFSGTPPDWIQVSILRDIIPWSGQILYTIIAKIQALADAYTGVIDEIKKFVDLLERKINALESFIKYLISILDFIGSLDVGFFVLSVPEIDGDVTDWLSVIDSAGGDVPPSGPTGYSAGIGFAYLAADIAAFTKAFSLIF